MGNSTHNLLTKCNSNTSLQHTKTNNHYQNPHSFMSYRIDKLSQTNNQYRLSIFRNQLYKEECFYVLNTLLQQYYNLFKQYNKVVVSEQLCLVTNLGQVKVDFCIDGPETVLNAYNEITHSFVTVVSQILQLVCNLSIDKAWFQSNEYNYFQERFTKVIYRCYSNQEKMFSQLLQEINFFMQKQTIKCNLVSAIIRCQNLRERHKTQKILSQSALYQKSPYATHSQSNITLQTDNPYNILSNRINMNENIHTFKIKDSSTKIDSYEDRRVSELRKAKFPVYRHKVVRTEGESYFENINRQHLRNHSSYLSQMPPTQRNLTKDYQITEQSKQSSHIPHYHISAQYSMQILNISNKYPHSKVSQKVQFKKEEDISENQDQRKSSIRQNNKMRQKQSSQVSMQKRTSIQEFNKNPFVTQKYSRLHTKSMLDDLARSVEVRDEPSSRSYIF